jgi:Ni,Fe-hydrogenase I small subunit
MTIYILCFKKDRYDSPHIHAAYMFLSTAIAKESEIKDNYFVTWIEQTTCYSKNESLNK